MAHRSGMVKTIETDTSTGKHRIHFVSDASEEHEEWARDVPSGHRLTIQQSQTIEQGTPLANGPLNLQEILDCCGQEATQRYLMNKVQQVYRGTGAVIHNKHMEKYDTSRRERRAALF